MLNAIKQASDGYTQTGSVNRKSDDSTMTFKVEMLEPAQTELGIAYAQAYVNTPDGQLVGWLVETEAGQIIAATSGVSDTGVDTGHSYDVLLTGLFTKFCEHVDSEEAKTKPLISMNEDGTIDISRLEAAREAGEEPGLEAIFGQEHAAAATAMSEILRARFGEEGEVYDDSPISAETRNLADSIKAELIKKVSH